MRYKVIYADPPWAYKEAHPLSGNRKRYGAVSNYPVLSCDDICNLPIQNITADHCALFLWSVGPQLPEALSVIEAWGFRYKTIAFTWVKLDTDGRPFFGMGGYTKSNAELCLLATKGKVTKLLKDQPNELEKCLRVVSNFESQVITTKRNNRNGIFHSIKPDKAYDKIEALFGDVPRIELFARRRREGWDAWGNQIKSDVELM